jgi:uncharacterized membrane protein
MLNFTQKKIKKHLPLIILSVFGSLLIFMGIANHYFFRTNAFDYGSYVFAFWDYSHFKISYSTLISCMFIQDHYSYTLMYFVPVYWLLNWITGTYTLIIIQNSMTIIAGWYTYKLILLKSKDSFLAIAGLLYFFFIIGRYTPFGSDCNIAVIASCFVPIFLYLYETRKYYYAAFVFALLLFSRENIPLWFIFIFIVLLIDHIKERKLVFLNIGGIIISILFFIFLFKVLIPSVETPDKPYTLFTYSALGNSPGEALNFMLSHPIDTTRLFFVNHLPDAQLDGLKAEFYWVYLLSGGFVLFLRPKYLIWFIPLLAQKMLNDSFYRWGISIYYTIEIVILLPIAVFYIIARIKNLRLKYILAITVCLMTLGVTFYKLEPTNTKFTYTMPAEKQQIYNPDFFKSEFNITKVNELLNLIPKDAAVSATNHIIPHLAQRKDIYFFPIIENAEYLVLSLNDHNFMLTKEDEKNEILKYLNSPYWEIIAQEESVILLKKSYTPVNKEKKWTF